MMRTLLVACGNPLRGDDGAAPEVLLQVARTPEREFRVVQQLTPELAEEMAPFGRVIFLDADAMALHVAIEPVSEAAQRSPLSHASTPVGVVALSRALFGFAGAALVCRIPARDFSACEIPPGELPLIREAAAELEHLL